MRRTQTAVIVGLLLAASAVRAEIVDRILAVVQGQLITLSDVRAVRQLGLVTPPGTGDAVRAILDRLIDRQLMLVEVERYGPPEPPAASIDARLAALRARFPDALAFETTLHQIGMTTDHLRRYVRDELRLESYLQQRFTAANQPTDDEIAGYYRLHAAEFVRDGVQLPYESARTEARARLIEERRTALVEEWLSGLRRRAEIVDLYLTQPAA